jgi:hypothetical protein
MYEVRLAAIAKLDEAVNASDEQVKVARALGAAMHDEDDAL